MISIKRAGQIRPFGDFQAGDSRQSTSHLHRLLASRPTETIGRGEIIALEGHPADYFFEIVSGCIRRYVIRGEGRRTIIDFGYPGDFFGATLLADQPFTTEAITALEVRRTPQATLRAWAEQHPGLKDELLMLATKDLLAAREHVSLLGCRLASEKVALFLEETARRLSRSDSTVRYVELPMSRSDIADFLGLTIESVSRALTQLKGDGLISFIGPRNVVLERRLISSASAKSVAVSRRSADRPQNATMSAPRDEPPASAAICPRQPTGVFA